MNTWKNWARRAARTLLVLATAASGWLLTAGMAVARSRLESAEPPPEKSYVVPYMLVVLCVALGLMVVCRPGRRATEPRIKVEDPD